jgi:hypothetical protein
MMDIMPKGRSKHSTEFEKLALAAICGFIAARLWPVVDTPGEALAEVGAIGADLRYWRAKEALRHAELRMGVQAQATQNLEARATAILGWSVAGVLALGAAVVNGSHPVAAGVVALDLFGAAMLCIIAITTRDWAGPGYRPEVVLDDRSNMELEILESLVDGYAVTIQRNSHAFHRFRKLLNWALGCIVAAAILAILGGLALLIAWYQARPVWL